MNNLIELDLADGSGYDTVPAAVTLIESFDAVKNEAFPDAKTFIRCHGPNGVSNLVTMNSLEELGQALNGNGDWFEATASHGNRVLFRKTSVLGRQGNADGTVLTAQVGGEVFNYQLVEPLSEVREAMNNPVTLAPPEGLTVVAGEGADVQPVADAPTPVE